jgi:hypothetical protein
VRRSIEVVREARAVVTEDVEDRRGDRATIDFEGEGTIAAA